MDLDDALIEVGQFGRYQWKIYFLLLWPLAFSAYTAIGYVFTAQDLDYRCSLEGCEDGLFLNPWVTAGIPTTISGEPEQCLRYAFVDGANSSCSFNRSSILHCDNFVFEDPAQTSIVTSYGLYCRENKWKLTLVGTLNNVGQFIGLPIIGFVSDRFGRKTMLIWSLVITSVVGIIKSFSPSYLWFLFIETIEAITSDGIYSGGFILGAELTGPGKRVVATSVLSGGYSVGEVILGGSAWILGDWQKLLRFIYTPGILFVIYFWILPESIRWLLNKGKTEEAIEILEKVAKQNNRSLSDATKDKFRNKEFSVKKDSDTKEAAATNDFQESPLREVLKSKKMLLRVANCSFSWMTHTLVFYGLSINSVAVAGNEYLNFILFSIAEIPGYIIAALIMDALGRRMSLSVSLGLSALSCLLFHFSPLDAVWVRQALFFSGKCAITCSFTVIYMFTAEMFPTNLRHSLLGICSMFGRVGSMLAPQAPLLALYIDPMLVLGSIALVASALALFFPETYNKPLPDSVHQAQEIDSK